MQKNRYVSLVSLAMFCCCIESSMQTFSTWFYKRKMDKADMIEYERVPLVKEAVWKCVTPGLSKELARRKAETEARRKNQAEYHKKRLDGIKKIHSLVGKLFSSELDEKEDRSWLGVSSAQGNVRSTMEDVYASGKGNGFRYAILCDGSGGYEVAEFATQYLKYVLAKKSLTEKTLATPVLTLKELAKILRASCAEVEKVWYQYQPLLTQATPCYDTYDAGSTALISVLTAHVIALANIGDCRAVLCRGGKALALSEDHKPTMERELKRIKEAGGIVALGQGNIMRVNRCFATSRSLGKANSLANINPTERQDGSCDFFDLENGDHRYGQHVIAEPDIFAITRDHIKDDFLVLGCDGIWDVMSSQDAVDCVAKGFAVERDLEKAANTLTELALKLGSTDNVTALVLDLRK